jgi:hypothetical protein
LLNRSYDITWFGSAYAKRFMKSVNGPKPGYASITCLTISKIPYNLIFTTKFNDSSILIMRMNKLVASQYQPRLSSITKIFDRRISQSDWNIQIKLNYLTIYNYSLHGMLIFLNIKVRWTCFPKHDGMREIALSKIYSDR